jgi:hypothetical protein
VLHPLLDGDAQLHAGEVGPEAPVDAEIERGVAVLGAVELHLVGVGEGIRVPGAPDVPIGARIGQPKCDVRRARCGASRICTSEPHRDRMGPRNSEERRQPMQGQNPAFGTGDTTPGALDIDGVALSRPGGLPHLVRVTIT